MSSPVIIVDYDPDGTIRFEEIKTKALAAFGPVAITIEHVGSTSVPDLSANPIIDIDVAVARERDVPAGIRLLRTLGYEHEGDLGSKGREALSTPRGTYPHHLYLVAANGREFKRHLTFRNRLRTDSEAASEYDEFKRHLVNQFLNDRPGYSNATTGFIERILTEEPGLGH
jgi:GrpB-like predicted nucleotidyltransferase (UPF0157 family)